MEGVNPTSGPLLDEDLAAQEDARTPGDPSALQFQIMLEEDQEALR